MKLSKLFVLIGATLIFMVFLSACKLSSDIKKQDKDNVSPSVSASENTVKESQFVVESESIYTNKIKNKFTEALSDNDIEDALKAAESYYKNTKQQINKLSLANEEIYTMFSIQEDSVGHVVIFEGEDSKINVNRYIVLEYISGEWIVKSEGF